MNHNSLDRNGALSSRHGTSTARLDLVLGLGGRAEEGSHRRALVQEHAARAGGDS